MYARNNQNNDQHRWLRELVKTIKMNHLDRQMVINKLESISLEERKFLPVQSKLEEFEHSTKNIRRTFMDDHKIVESELETESKL